MRAATLAIAVMTATPAAAQTIGQAVQLDGNAAMFDPNHYSGARWGGDIDGRWYAGSQAPGGWNAYSRPDVGARVPAYWRASRWAINDWAFYRLPSPPAGLIWSRYYDDAVLIDPRGRVAASVGGLDWRGAYATPTRPVVDYRPPRIITTTVTTVTEEWVRPPAGDRPVPARGRRPHR